MKHRTVIIPEPRKYTLPAQPHALRRLVRCCRCLGIRLGYRYWKLDNKARRGPGLVPVICTAMEAAADRLRADGNEIEASLMEEWAATARKANRQFHAANSKHISLGLLFPCIIFAAVFWGALIALLICHFSK